MTDDIKLTHTRRVDTALKNGHGTLTGRTGSVINGVDNDPLVEVVLDGAPDQPVWLRSSEIEEGDHFEASVTVDYDVDSPEEAALTLLQWLADPQSVSVTLKGSHNLSYDVHVEWIDGVPTASLQSIYFTRGVSGQPSRPPWAEPLLTKATAARVETYRAKGMLREGS